MLGEDPRPFAGDRSQPEAGVRHHVADDLDATGDALGKQRLAGAFVGTEEEGGQRVDGYPVVLLRHGQVAAPQPGLDVRDRDARVPGRLGAGAGRVGVAEDERPVGAFLSQHRRDRGSHRGGVGGVEVEPVARLGQRELVVEDVGELRIPVLAGVESDLLDAGFAESSAQRARLDELGTVPHHGQDFHGGEATMAAAAGR